jgi:ABC-2 type transport system permease protein
MAGFDPAAIGLAGVQLAQIAVGVLGVLLVTSEYATGMIRTSMVAVPRRLPVLWAKGVRPALPVHRDRVGAGRLAAAPPDA